MVEFHNVDMPDVEGILGWLTFDEVRVLQSIVFFVSGLPGVLVEIGSYCGRSTVAIGYTLSKGCCGVLYAVDPHDGNVDIYGVDSYTALISNIEKFELKEYVRVVRMKSEEYCQHMLHPVKMLFIDGNHDYEAVKRDWDMWKGKIVKRGMVLFHDSFEDGVNKVIMEVDQDREFSAIIQVGSITGFIKEK